MSERNDLMTNLSPVKRRLLDELRRVSQVREPIAIVGMAARFPTAKELAGFWRALIDGRDVVSDVPPARWNTAEFYDPDPTARGKTNSRWGGFIADLDAFDAAFFRIADQEAARIDPQQRILLELAWEALEDAGQVPSALAGSDTGVFVGLTTSEYGTLQWTDVDLVDEYALTGTALTIGANRLSYFFDLRGPSMSVSTACSSSLLAVHLACQSIWNRETSLALAGGVNVILSPAGAVNMTKTGLLSPDGRCRPFDASAAGFARGEGGGLVVLKPLSAALADNDRVYGCIRGSASNQNGRTNGLAAPNPDAQERLLRQAYRNAGVSPASVSYVEAFAAGTPLGDAIEAKALTKVLSEGRAPGQVCRLGSVKSNIGHTEAASGVASLMKVALALTEKKIPPTLYFERPNAHLKLDETRFRIENQLIDWPAGAPAVAGVSSFGLGGSNVHVVVAQAPELPTRPALPARAEIVPFSAHSPAALSDKVADFVEWLAGQSAPSLADIAYTAGARRAHLPFRCAVVANDLPELESQLLPYIAQKERRSDDRPMVGRRVAFVFPHRLTAEVPRSGATAEPAFTEALERCERVMGPLTGGSQATAAWTFAVQVALAAAWRAYGLEPAYVAGEGLGELAAAHVAGALSLEDAARLVLAASDTREGAMEAEAARVVVQTPSRKLFSATRANFVQPVQLDARHWMACVTGAPASLERAAQLDSDEHVALLVMSGRYERFWPAGAVASVRTGEPPRTSMLKALAELYTAGVDVSFQHLFTTTKPRLVTLPAYPWQRSRHWLEGAVFPMHGVQPAHLAGGHPVLGTGLEVAGTEARIWQRTLDRNEASLETREGLVALAAKIAIAVAREAGIGPSVQLSELAVTPAAGHERATMQVKLAPATDAESGRGFRLELFVRPATDAAGTGSWTLLAHGLLRAEHGASARTPLALQRAAREDALKGAALEQLLARQQGRRAAPYVIDAVWRDEDQVLARVQRIPDAGAGQAQDALFQACLDAVALVASAGAETAAMSRCPDIVWWGQDSTAAWIQMTVRAAQNSTRVEADVQVGAEDGQPILALSGWSFEIQRPSTTARAVAADGIGQYTVAWRPRPQGLAACLVPGTEALRWLILADRGGFGARLTTLLESAGHACVQCYAAGPAGGHQLAGRVVDPTDLSALRGIIEAGVDGSAFTGVIHAWALDGDTLDAAPGLNCGSLARTVQALILSDGVTRPRLWVITRGAQAVGEPAPVHTFQAPIWGLGKTIAFEHPELECTRIDLDPNEESPAANAQLVFEEVSASDRQDQVAYRGGLRHVQRLTMLDDAALVRSELTIQQDATYVLTGGTGYLGSIVAEWLARQGARHLVLLARGETPPEAERIEGIRKLGAQVHTLACDVADRDKVRERLQQIRNTMPPLRGIVHLAGAYDDGMIADLAMPQFREIFAPKVAGASHLHELTRCDSLDFFVMFSSAVSVLGSPGQALYAAANAYLDALAHHRQALGLPGLSVNWGPWASGDQTDSVINTIPVERGLELLRRFLEENRTQIVVLSGRLEDLLQFYPRAGDTPLFAELGGSGAPKLRTYKRRDVGEYVAPQTEAQKVIAGIWRRVLAIDRVSTRDAFFEIGGDSIMAGHVISRINDIFGAQLTLQDAFSAFTVETLAELVEQQLTQQLAELSDEQVELLLQQE